MKSLTARDRLELVNLVNGIRTMITSEGPEGGIELCDQEIARLCDVEDLKSTSAERMRKMRARIAAEAEAKPKTRRGRAH